MGKTDMIDKIKDVLEEREITVSKLATMLPGNVDTRRKDLYNILNRKRDPGRKYLEEIAAALGLEWDLVGTRIRGSLAMLLDRTEADKKK